MATHALAEAAPFGPPATVRLVSRRRETHDTASLVVEWSGAAPAPGQFNMLYALGQGEIPISISGSAGSLLTHTIRAVGPVSSALTRLQPDAGIGLRGPFGRGWPLSECRGRDVLVIAGGVGLAPLRLAIRALLGDRDAYGRITLLYGARTPDDLLFRSELERWRARFDIEVLVSVDAAPRGWRGDVGVVTGLFRRAAIDEDQTVAMVCGPEVMMRFAAAGLQDAGLDPSQIWISMERNMQCGTGVCGHCLLGPLLVCRDGPVFSLAETGGLLGVREL